MEILNVTIGVLSLLIGFAAGGMRTRKRYERRQPNACEGCHHHYSFHEHLGGRCKDPGCMCQQFVGMKPIKMEM